MNGIGSTCSTPCSTLLSTRHKRGRRALTPGPWHRVKGYSPRCGGKGTRGADFGSGDPPRGSANGPPDHKETTLLMADQDPTGSGSTVALSIPAGEAKFLRGVFTAARAGVRDELTEYPEKLREPTRLHREEAAYGKLLDGLDTGSIVPERDVRDLLRHLAEVIDQDNEYERVIAEHKALHGLLGQLTEGRAR